MTITEALTLAKEKPGTKVRPVGLWDKNLSVIYRPVCPDVFLLCDNDELDKGSFGLCGVEELLGPWEVVK